MLPSSHASFQNSSSGRWEQMMLRCHLMVNVSLLPWDRKRLCGGFDIYLFLNGLYGNAVNFILECDGLVETLITEVHVEKLRKTQERDVVYRPSFRMLLLVRLMHQLQLPACNPLVDFSYQILPFFEYDCHFAVTFLINPMLLGSNCQSASLSFGCWRDLC